MKRFEGHAHSMFSNIRLLDSTSRPETLIARAKDIGLERIALTDHECLAGAVKFYKKAQEEKVKIALGNEIYLTDTRDMKQKYFHFILIAKDKIGFRQLRELSSESWMNSYYDRGMERVPTLKSELAAIVKKDPGHLIATSACIGSEFGYNWLEYKKAKQVGNDNYVEECKNKILSYYNYCVDLFGKDFYFEIAPGLSEEQVYYNSNVVKFADKYGVKVVIGTDTHYLTKEDRYVHKAFLNSKGGEREVDDFYEYAYLQNEEDIKKNLGQLSDRYKEFCENSLESSEKICNDYELLHPQQIPHVPVQDYPKKDSDLTYPTLKKMYQSDDIYDRYWVNQCCDKLKELNKYNEEYLNELEEEARVKTIVGEKLNTNVFAYPITLQYYINMMWDSGSTIGAGRGSSCAGLNHYLLGVTQLDPIQWQLPFFRYLNEDRIELPDIDIDLAPSKRPMILQQIKQERGQRFIDGLTPAARQNLGCTLVATFGTTSSKNAIITACRGYRSEQYQDGLDVDISQYLSSLIPIERGAAWTIEEVIHGNKEKNREPVQTFINEVSKYPGLLKIIQGIEGLIDKRGSHASGVIFYDEDPYEFGCFMKTPNGDIETQFDLHDSEAMGLTKYDFLVTDVQDKIVKCIEFLQEYGEIEQDLSLKEIYDKYLHPNVLNLEDKEVWKNIQSNSILSLFQFDSPIGSQGIDKVRPSNINELNATNGLIRLLPERGQESPMDKYIRFKENPDLWLNEMATYKLTGKEQNNFRKYLSESCGIGISQEQLMKVLMDKDLGCFTLSEANAARKTIAKKQMDKIEALHDLIKEKAINKQVASYIWDAVVRPQTGYSFSTIHSLAYAIIAYQTAYLATHFNSIYWNTSCLVVNSGSLENEDDESDKKRGVNYAKLATAIGAVQKEGINLSLVNINTSDFSFQPDVKNNRILYGLNGVTRVNAEMIDMIKKGRPYKGLKDFMNRCPLSKLPMINLIKAGAFEEVDSVLKDRYSQMIYYINFAAEPKKKLTMQNVNGLINYNVLPKELDNERKLFNYNQYLKKFCADGDKYIFDDRAYEYFNKNFNDYNDKLDCIDNNFSIDKSVWKTLYDNRMSVVKTYINGHQQELLNKFNTLLFKECWKKYAEGNLSKWEMDSLCFYHGPHELSNINYNEYGISNYEDIEPEKVERYFRKNDINIPIYSLYTIIGTVVAKNDTRHVVSLLTPTGMVNVKFSREYYAEYKSSLKYEGHIVETGWFSKGTKIMVTGYRRGEDEFVCKTYSKTKKHQLYKITKLLNNGKMEFVHDRFKADGVQEVEEENNYEE